MVLPLLPLVSGSLVVRFNTELGLDLLLSVPIDVASIVQFDRSVRCGLVTQGGLVVSTSVGVINLLVTQPFVLRWVVRNASICALKSGHEMSLEGVWRCPDGRSGPLRGKERCFAARVATSGWKDDA